MRMNFTQKSAFLFVLLTFFNGMYLWAQPIVANGSFENWETQILYSVPTEWMSSPMFDSPSATLSKVTDDASEGTYAVKLTSIQEDDEYISEGILIIGNVSDDNVEGAPWTESIDQVHVSVKYDIQEGDGTMILLNLYNADTITGRMLYTITGSSAEWTTLDLPVVFGGDGTPVQPEKIFFAIISSYPDEIPPGLLGPDFDPELYVKAAGSWVMVDNVYFTMGESSEKILPANNSFENWIDAEITDPASWITNNRDFLDNTSKPVTRSEDAVEGTYSARLEVMNSWGWSGAWLSLGSQDTGIIFSEKPKAISFSYKYAPVDGDMGGMNLTFNGTIEGVYSQYFGGTGYQFSQTTDGWVDVFRVLGYDKAGLFEPDHLILQFMAGSKDGSVLYIDNVKFVDVTPITFIVRDNETNDPVPYAQISISGIDYNIQLNENGMAEIQLPDDDFTYSIAAQGYNTSSGNFTIPADGDSVSVKLTPFVPDASKPVLTITDSDEDKVYFNGDLFSVDIKLPDSYPIPNGLQVNVTQFLYPDGSETPEAYTIFQEGTMNVTAVNNNTITVSGTIGEINKSGVIGFNATVNLGTVYDIGTYPVIDTYRFNPDLSSFGQAFVGIAIPDDAGFTTEPELSTLANLYGFSSDSQNDVPIAFVKEGQGKILFNPALNFIDHRNELNNLQTQMHIMASPETGYYAEVNPASQLFQGHTPVTVSLGNIPEDIPAGEIEILETNFGIEPDEYAYSYTDGAATIENSTFTFNVWGYSRYTLRHPGLKATNTQKIDAETIQFYPNPAGDYLNILSGQTIQKVLITNLSGQHIMEKTPLPNHSLNIQSLSPGYYLLNLTLEDGNLITLPFIKK